MPRILLVAWTVLLPFGVPGRVAKAHTQSEQPPEVRRLPVWPGQIPVAEMARGEFVFRDENGEIVVCYPDPANPSHIVTFRFWLQNRVDPEIKALINRRPDGQFAYHYTVRNGPGAKTGIWAWSVVGPPSKELIITHPVWSSVNPYQAVVAPQVLLKHAETGVFMRWDRASSPIAPGTELANFEIVTRFRPGLTTAYASGKEDPIRSPAELTEAVELQIRPLERAPVMFKPVLTVGPRFDEHLSNHEILLAYRTDIRDLIDGGVLRKDSLFIQEFQRLIDLAVGSPQPSIQAPKENPQGPLEESLLAALKLALTP